MKKGRASMRRDTERIRKWRERAVRRGEKKWSAVIGEREECKKKRSLWDGEGVRGKTEKNRGRRRRETRGAEIRERWWRERDKGMTMLLKKLHGGRKGGN